MMTLSAIISGVLLAISFPPANAYPLAWAALIPILAVVGRTTFRETLLLGYLFGASFYGGVLWWITPAYVFNGAPWWHGAICFLTATHYLAFMIAVPFMVTYRYLCIPNAEDRGHHPRLLAVLPMLAGALWTGFEYIATHAVDAFAAGIMGYCQWKFLPIAQVSATFGVHAVSFLLAAVNTAGALTISGLRRDSHSAVYAAAPTMVLLLVCWMCGLLALDDGIPSSTSSQIKIALLQGHSNTQKIDSWEGDFKAYKKLAIQASRNRPSLIVWPESAVPPTESLHNELHEMASMAKETKTWHLFGAISTKRIFRPFHDSKHFRVYRPESDVL